MAGIMRFDISNMLKADVFNHPVSKLELIETHISWVILTGKFAYKIKKPVDFGFLNFSTLDNRREFCEQELHLNQRLAPSIYLEVVTITGTSEKLLISGKGTALEYAVKMTQFPQTALLDFKLSAGELSTEQFSSIARMVAEFHQKTKVANASMEYGNADLVYNPVTENFDQIYQKIDDKSYSETLNKLKIWCKSEFQKLKAIFLQRKSNGFIRECHGDMHLSNMLWLADRPMAFDCIEFNPSLRWIDVMSEVAFLVMDLQAREQPQLANHFLNKYLEITGDYAGISVLPFYLCYRALVRAKVNALSLNSTNTTSTMHSFENYLNLASFYSQQSAVKLIIMRGLSASGKSTISQQVMDKLGAIRIRSDVERKRLFENSLTTDINKLDKKSKINSGLYSAQASQQTYKKLAQLATQVISAGYSVIIDAAFLKYNQREVFQLLAKELSVPFVILEVTAAPEILRKRIKSRKNDASDADLSVLEHQLSTYQALNPDEIALTINSTDELDIHALVDAINIIN